MKISTKKALITGITGQDGSYLSELLLDKGYEVHGIIRRASTFNTERIDHIIDKLNLYHGDVTDGSFISNLLHKYKFDEIYHLASQSHVRVSFDNPVFTSDVTGTATAIILEALRAKHDRKTRFYFAGSSELFGNASPPHNENTPISPRSPYGCAKSYGYWMVKNYREGYGLHASTGILFNHESPRRGQTFVTCKIAAAAARIKFGLQDKLYLGNLEAIRDWGYAPDYVEAMWLMLQQERPDDYVIATGTAHSVKEFLEAVFDYFQLDWKDYVEIDERYFRPTEVDYLRGEPHKAYQKLGWKPKVGFKELVEIMAVEAYAQNFPHS